MSTEAYARAKARENKIWTPFVHSFSFNATQTNERGIIYGLYSNSYLNQNKYLVEIEAADLANLLADYNSKIAELNTQEQAVVADIVSKRYLAGIDKLIHDEKLITKRAGIEADDDIWDAKTAALSTDQAALQPLAERVSSETEKTAARITELQAYIAIEGMNLSEVNIAIAEKAIQSSKVDIQKLDTANAVLRIQIATVQAAQELVDIDLKTARTKIDISEIDRSMNKIDLLGSELTIEQAKTDVAEAELGVSAARVTLAGAKTNEVEEEIDHVRTTLTQQVQTNYENKRDLMDVKQAGREDSIVMHRQEKDLDHENKLAASNLDVTFANADKTLQESLDTTKVSVMDAKASNVWLKVSAAIAAEEKLATANIKTTLTHTVEKKK